MRKLKIVALVLLVLILIVAGYVAFLYVKAGELKSIEPHFAGTCRPVEGAVGAEDITIHPNGRFAFISSDDRRSAIAGELRPGAILAYELNAEEPELVNLTPDMDETFHPHGINLFVYDGGSARLFVVNHPRGFSMHGEPPGEGPPHTIEVFDVTNSGLEHLQTLADPLLVSPNDVVAVGPDQFYVTNDHGANGGLARTLEDYLRLSNSNVLYYDGESFAEVADDITYANGINISNDGSQIFVASPSHNKVIVFDRDQATNALTRTGEVDVGTGVDNIEVDAEGSLWIGAHPKLLTFLTHAGDATNLSPSQVLRLTPGGEDGFVAEEVFLSDGSDMSGSTVAARHGQRLLIGSVFDGHFLDCRLPD